VRSRNINRRAALQILWRSTGNYRLRLLLWDDVPGEQALPSLWSGSSDAHKRKFAGAQLPALPH
jgi:muconolactone delta-isomerase